MTRWLVSFDASTETWKNAYTACPKKTLILQFCGKQNEVEILRWAFKMVLSYQVGPGARRQRISISAVH